MTFEYYLHHGWIWIFTALFRQLALGCDFFPICFPSWQSFLTSMLSVVFQSNLVCVLTAIAPGKISFHTKTKNTTAQYQYITPFRQPVWHSVQNGKGVIHLHFQQAGLTKCCFYCFNVDLNKWVLLKICKQNLEKNHTKLSLWKHPKMSVARPHNFHISSHNHVSWQTARDRSLAKRKQDCEL